MNKEKKTIKFSNIYISLRSISLRIKIFLSCFLFVLTLGYLSGLDLLNFTTNFSVSGIERNILGAPENYDQDVIYFKMPKAELNTIVHTHLISLSCVFLLLGLIFNCTNYNLFLKKFFMVEPMICLVTTFGSMWLLWHGFIWTKYLIMISGLIMHSSFIIMIFLIYKDMFFQKTN